MRRNLLEVLAPTFAFAIGLLLNPSFLGWIFAVLGFYVGAVITSALWDRRKSAKA